MEEVVARKLPGADNHHTLYYRRHYLSLEHTKKWRNHPVMIVPLYLDDHMRLHNNVPPVEDLPSTNLAHYALYRCALIQTSDQEMSDVEAFANLRDDLDLYFRRNRGSEMGKEALKFAQQFTNQLAYMREVPILGRGSTESSATEISRRHRG